MPEAAGCAIEIAIRLLSLGLDPATLLQDTGWVTAGENGTHFYYPAGGRAIGMFAGYLNFESFTSGISETDPTT